jgi:hypothetical protein
VFKERDLLFGEEFWQEGGVRLKIFSSLKIIYGLFVENNIWTFVLNSTSLDCNNVFSQN